MHKVLTIENMINPSLQKTLLPLAVNKRPTMKAADGDHLGATFLAEG